MSIGAFPIRWLASVNLITVGSMRGIDKGLALLRGVLGGASIVFYLTLDPSSQEFLCDPSSGNLARDVTMKSIVWCP